ncbi:aldo/keto reductase [Dictyobacter aurantiacus]|uniref:Oxidoreductase n=1 Tax=Dictyobacter aurantiacus TaxID=1936993 RepID=A0A401ZS08_9CHLR|nr:aldo/keto reductase [Dictyobacter aurantiacus]GCE09574.1 oxidoreductase [Dictyobacter aurantiacus]
MSYSQSNPILPLRTLGKTGLQVPALCVGCAPLGDMPDTFAYSVPEERALETIRAIFKSPITFVDTAASYGDGESERRIGVVLKELGGVPAGYVLASKADRDLKTGDFSGDQMRRSVERSLRLLGLDRLPLLYLHDPEHTTFEAAMAPNGPVEVLQRCKEEGLIEHLGVAGGPIDLMTRFVETDIFEAAISHNRYTLLNTEADPFWDVCQRHGVGAVNAAPYGSGMLAKGPRAYARYEYGEAPKEYVEKAIKFEDACQRYNIPLAAVALQFSLRDPRIHSTVIGMTRPERLDETVKLAQTVIPDELWREIEVIRLS